MKQLNELNEKELVSKHQSKAADSFTTKFNLYLFDCWLKNPNIFDLSLLDEAKFDEFILTDKLIEYYTTYYWQELVEETLINNRSIKDTWYALDEFKKKYEDVINNLKRHYIDGFKRVFPFEAFRKLLIVPKEEYKCHYCNITIDKIIELAEKKQLFKKQLTRGFVIEIDRIRPNEEYKEDNCVLCCYWCNNAKTDEFTGEEFEQIGKEIEKVWRNRLQKK